MVIFSNITEIEPRKNIRRSAFEIYLLVNLYTNLWFTDYFFGMRKYSQTGKVWHVYYYCRPRFEPSTFDYFQVRTLSFSGFRSLFQTMEFISHPTWTIPDDGGRIKKSSDCEFYRFARNLFINSRHLRPMFVVWSGQRVMFRKKKKRFYFESVLYNRKISIYSTTRFDMQSSCK